jgi:hypothetical protein
MKLAAMTLLGIWLFHHPLVCQPANEDDPPTVLWREIKRELSGPHGREYFEKSIKDVELPTLYGTLVSSTPADHPDEFLVAMADNPRPEVTLKLNGRLEKPLPAGTPVKFDGVGSAFTTEPFMLTFQVGTVNRATVPDRKESAPGNKKNSK